MYFIILYVNWYNVVSKKKNILKQNFRKFDYLISIFKMAVGYHGNITLAN